MQLELTVFSKKFYAVGTPWNSPLCGRKIAKCADPERFVRGDATLTSFFVLLF